MNNYFSEETVELISKDLLDRVTPSALAAEFKARDVPPLVQNKSIELAGRKFKLRCNQMAEEVRRDLSGTEVIVYDYKNDTSTYYTRQHYDIAEEELLPVEQRLENDIQRRYAEVDSSLEAVGEMEQEIAEYQQSIDVIMRDLFIG